jgi:FtsH-binding integral membrane protein
VQQLDIFRGSFSSAFAAVFVGMFGQLFLQRITDFVRERWALADDGAKSEWEEMWDEETEEAENDVMGLTVSFLLVNALRFGITDCLPNQEGAEEECSGHEEYMYHHTLPQKAMMMGLGLLFTVGVFILYEKMPEWTEQENLSGTWQLVARFLQGCCASLSMALAWAYFYGTQMLLASIPALEGAETILAVVLTLTITFVGFFSLIGLDEIKKMDSGKIGFDDEKVDKAIEAIMVAISTLVGFSFEQCFDKSVDSLAEKSNSLHVPHVNQHTSKFVLSIFCSGLLVPAWKKYMLTAIQDQCWRYGYLHDLPRYEQDDDKKERLTHLIKDASKLIRKIKSCDIQEEEEDIKEEVKRNSGQMETLMEPLMSSAPTSPRLLTPRDVHRNCEQYRSKHDELHGSLKVRAGLEEPNKKELDELRKEKADLEHKLATCRKEGEMHMDKMVAKLKLMTKTVQLIEAKN